MSKAAVIGGGFAGVECASALSRNGIIVDLFEMKAYIYNDNQGIDISVTEIPEDMKEKAEEYRAMLVEAVASTDEELMMKFLEDDGEVFGFLDHVYGVVDPHVETYMKRGFNSLMVCFGCTGGQHRSVYSAEHMAHHLAQKYPRIRVRLIHREQHLSFYVSAD